MIPAVRSHTWRRHRNLARQPCNYNGWTIANRRLSVAVDGRKIKRESWGTKSSRWCHQNRWKFRQSKVESRGFFKLWSPTFWLFFGDVDSRGMMAGLQASDWYQAWPIGWPESQDMAGSISGQMGRVFGSVLIASLSLFFYFYLLFNRLTLVFFHICYSEGGWC